MKTIIVSLLICYLFAFAAANRRPTADPEPTSSSIVLDVYPGSNPWWLAIAVSNAGVDTRSVQMQEAQSTKWESMSYSNGWGYFSFTSNERIKFPVSVRLTSVNGDEVTVAVSSVSVGTINTGVSYGSAPSNPTAANPTSGSNPTSRANPATSAPTDVATFAATSAPTKHASAPAATTKATTKAPAATKKPTSAPSTTGKSATSKPTTPHAATASPTTRPTSTGSSSSGSSTGCSGGLKLLVPLYMYPGAPWDTVAASGSVVSTVAIINPDSGPGNGPDSTFTTYMNKLHQAGVEMIGYVHTSYGARAIADVKAEIDIYATQFPLLVGIFLDEAAATASEVSYYTELYTYIMGMPGWKYDVINPGAVPTSGYLNAATQIVSFEDTVSKFASSANPSFATCSNKDQFAVITYAASSSQMQSAVSSAVSKGYYGWVYVTDGAAGCCTYNTLASYYASMASYVASAN